MSIGKWERRFDMQPDLPTFADMASWILQCSLCGTVVSHIGKRSGEGLPVCPHCGHSSWASTFLAIVPK
jgi:rRNA maturation endonuclease Nob1